jgi:hypothetical protein
VAGSRKCGRCGGCCCWSKSHEIRLKSPNSPDKLHQAETTCTRQADSQEASTTHTATSTADTSFSSMALSCEGEDDKSKPRRARERQSRSPQACRPTPHRNSRTFTSGRKADPDDLPYDNSWSSPSGYRRSTSYASPLEFGDSSVLSQRPDRLTKNNLETLLKELDLEKTPHAPKSASSSAPGDQGPSWRPVASAKPKAMPKPNFKSPRKSDKKKSKPDTDSHPLNSYFPSAAMSGDDGRSTPMDLNGDAPTVNGSSQPPTPSHDAPGAFPGEETNGVDERDDKSPTPPPHKVPPTPKIDPEACKAAGNKFFKAKDYGRAVQEYTKGKSRVCGALRPFFANLSSC